MMNYGRISSTSHRSSLSSQSVQHQLGTGTLRIHTSYNLSSVIQDVAGCLLAGIHTSYHLSIVIEDVASCLLAGIHDGTLVAGVHGVGDGVHVEVSAQLDDSTVAYTHIHGSRHIRACHQYKHHKQITCLNLQNRIQVKQLPF